MFVLVVLVEIDDPTLHDNNFRLLAIIIHFGGYGYGYCYYFVCYLVVVPNSMITMIVFVPSVVVVDVFVIDNCTISRTCLVVETSTYLTQYVNQLV